MARLCIFVVVTAEARPIAQNNGRGTATCDANVGTWLIAVPFSRCSVSVTPRGCSAQFR
jgi:hypothetical protein